MMKIDQVVSVQWLKEHLKDEPIILLDASPTFDKSATIQGAQHFDIKNVFSDTSSPYPNAFPSVLQFEKESRKLGINKDSHIIVFDSKGIFTSPRVWWMFRTMGHQNISVLDGGFPEWQANGFLTGKTKSGLPEEGDFRANFNPAAVKTYNQVIQNIKTEDCLVLDARSKGRFTGSEPEPRKHIKSGHIKNSVNLPYTKVLENGKYKSRQKLKAIFDDLELDDKPLIFSCGSGITACIILLAFDLISDQAVTVYDGSWTEWAEKEELFVK